MLEKLEKLWATQKTVCIILGLILLPITLLILGTKLYMMYNEYMAKSSLDKAQKEDNKLAAEEDALKQASNQALSEANEAASRIEDRKKEEVDLDWHTKRKD